MAAFSRPGLSAVPPPTKLPLSVAVIALDAESQLGALLSSVAFADEVVVVDSGSRDGTVALAERMGARVIRQDWLGFGRQKQFAVTAARHDWVLCLDADERVTPELAASLAKALADPRYKAFRMARRNRFLGRWLSHGEAYPDWSLRLFHRAHAGWSNDDVHETVLTTAEVGRLAGDLLHESAEDVATYLAKQNRYTSLHAEALYRQGVRAGYARLFVNPLVRFLKFYFLRLGILDGGPGFAHVAIGCQNTFHKYLKLIERQKAEK
ncbi:MAG: glycosyltransferase family 2 protein [Betaproteobacteria bacterium]|nr:glycosyltransferase family 2 protein [Betaproteobacteria bacterium]